MTANTAYDEIGQGYAQLRRPDPRIAAAIEAALGDATSVVNVGAGTGSYEPRARRVVAVEPSAVMIRQRPVDAVPAIQARAESLPLATDGFDAATALLSIHHWTDWRTGLSELCRVAPRRGVWTFDGPRHNSFWMIRDYFPGAARVAATTGVPPIAEVARVIGATRVEPVPVPADCTDAFGWASWRRPERFLDDSVCAATSCLAQLPEAELRAGQRHLADDLRTGRWHDHYRHLLDLPEIDGGFRLVIRD